MSKAKVIKKGEIGKTVLAKDLAEALQEKGYKVTQKESALFVNEAIDLITNYLKSGYSVRIPGFVRFDVKKYGKRRVVLKGKKITIPPRKEVRARVSTGLRDIFRKK